MRLGAALFVKQPSPHKGVGVAPLMTEAPLGCLEPFGVITLADRSDSAPLSSGLAMAGLGSTHKSKQAYVVDVSPTRYAALVRAYKGRNASIIAEIKARGS